MRQVEPILRRADIWARVRERLQSSDLALMRKARRLIDLTQTEVEAALAAELDGLDGQGLRQLWAIVVSVGCSQERRWLASRQHPEKQRADERAAAATAWQRRQNSFAIADRIKRRLAELGQGIEPVGVGSKQKLDAWMSLSKALARHAASNADAGWTAETQAEAERLIAELERLRVGEPRDYLDADLGWGIGTVREGIADQLNAAGKLAEAKRYYFAAVDAFAAVGYGRDARRCRQSLVAMVRRLSAGFDETIIELNAMLEESGASKSSVAYAEMRTALAQTYALVGDVTAAKVQLDLAAKEVAACGYAAADIDAPERTVSAWIERADVACPVAEDFEAEIASLITLHAAASEARGRIDTDEAVVARQMQAAETLTALGDQLDREVMGLLVAQSRERKAFIAEFGDLSEEGFETIEPVQTRIDKQIAALGELNGALDRLRSEMGRRQGTGASMDDLLPETERIESEARRHDLLVAAGAALLLRADIHMASERFANAVAAARAAFDLPRPAQQDLTMGLYALDRIIDAGIAQNDPRTLSAVCGEAITLIERHRYNISAPYSQSAYLQERTRYYTMGIDTAYRCEDFDAVLQRTEASKAAGSLRQVGQALHTASVEELDAQFASISSDIERATSAMQIDAVEALRARRRAVWDMLSIARARAAGAMDSASVTLKAVCSALEPDEAVVYYYWLVREVLLVAAIDRERIRIKKLKLPEKIRQDIDELAAYAQSVRESNSYLDTVRQFSRFFLPDEIRPVLSGKRRIIFSPHRVLHALPLHALTYDGDFLIRRFAVSYVPNLGCLLRRFEPVPTKRVLAVGVRNFAIPETSLRPIEEAEVEVDAVAAAHQRYSVPVTTLQTE